MGGEPRVPRAARGAWPRALGQPPRTTAVSPRSSSSRTTPSSSPGSSIPSSGPGRPVPTRCSVSSSERRRRIRRAQAARCRLDRRVTDSCRSRGRRTPSTGARSSASTSRTGPSLGGVGGRPSLRCHRRAPGDARRRRAPRATVPPRAGRRESSRSPAGILDVGGRTPSSAALGGSCSRRPATGTRPWSPLGRGFSDGRFDRRDVPVLPRTRAELRRPIRRPASTWSSNAVGPHDRRRAFEAGLRGRQDRVGLAHGRGPARLPHGSRA